MISHKLDNHIFSPEVVPCDKDGGLKGTPPPKCRPCQVSDTLRDTLTVCSDEICGSKRIAVIHGRDLLTY
jgi:hypothetical protein